MSIPDDPAAGRPPPLRVPAFRVDSGIAPPPRALLPAASEGRRAAFRVAFVAGSVFPANPDFPADLDFPADPDFPVAEGALPLSFSRIRRERLPEATAPLEGAA